MTHRGSNLSVASDDEIRKVESDEMILEDEEGEEEAEKDCTKKVAETLKGKKAPALENVGEDPEDDEEIDKVLFGDADDEEGEVPKPAPLKTKTTETVKPAETSTTKSETEALADKVSKVKIQD